MKTSKLKWWMCLALLLVGVLMVAPSAFAADAGGYSATCKDGTSWTGTSRRGACHGHKGVQSWNGTAAASGTAAATGSGSSHEHESSSSTKPETASAAGATPASASATNDTAAVTATCKDGSTWSGKSRRGACRGHKGVQSWSGGTAAATVPTPAAAPRQASTHASATNHSSAGSTGTPAPGGGNGKVWVNSTSKVYHCPGTRWYGTTKQGEYMTEAQAKAQGYRPDHGKACSN
jgi:hypothetical protein